MTTTEIIKKVIELQELEDMLHELNAEFDSIKCFGSDTRPWFVPWYNALFQLFDDSVSYYLVYIILHGIRSFIS